MSYINRLFGSIATITPTDSLESGNIDENHLISIDTSNNRIGINTIDPECSIDISGDDAKLKTKYLEVSGDISYDISNQSKSITILHDIVKKLYIDSSDVFTEDDKSSYNGFFNL
jgi:hypothetical protein